LRIALANISSPGYKYLKALLSNNQDLILKEQAAIPAVSETAEPVEENRAYIRGAGYYGGISHDK